MMLTKITLLLLALAPQQRAWAGANTDSVCPMVRIEVGRLPDLNIPRPGRRTLCVNGELTVFGGHATGFVATQTAE